MQITEAAAVKKSGITTKELVIDAMLIALTYIFTAFVNLRLPIAANGGLIHLGNVPLFLAAIIFGRRTAPWPEPSAWVFLTCCPAGISGLRSPS